ncbi:hypothetical protein F4780DRAFT_744565, partial [Xylariomycetidae sp. FL0641]
MYEMMIRAAGNEVCFGFLVYLEFAVLYTTWRMSGAASLHFSFISFAWFIFGSKLDLGKTRDRRSAKRKERFPFRRTHGNGIYACMAII